MKTKCREHENVEIPRKPTRSSPTKSSHCLTGARRANDISPLLPILFYSPAFLVILLFNQKRRQEKKKRQNPVNIFVVYFLLPSRVQMYYTTASRQRGVHRPKFFFPSPLASAATLTASLTPSIESFHVLFKLYSNLRY